MPNLIEQQDLLKGLTDQRLAMLMQQPTATIPPFLVAAEAQRRQAIRSQFSGGAEKNESVVDSLTRQMAGAPQNVNANPPAPPAPPLQQMGIAGIQPQGMADGGPVRRFAADGYVDPNESYYQDPFGIPYVPDTSIDIGKTITDAVMDPLYNLKHSPFPRWETADEREKRIAKETDTLPAEENAADIAAQVRRLPKPKTEAPDDPGKDDSSPENKAKDVYKGLPPEYRNRLKALYSDAEPSSWERAQKWFDASQAFFQPNATTGEMIADAISAFGSGMAAERQAERAAATELDRALLEYDINAFNAEQDYRQKLAAAEATAAEKALERRTPTAANVMEFYSAQIKSLAAQMKDIDADIDLTPEQKAAEKKTIREQMDAYAAKAAGLMDSSGYDANAMTLDQLKKLAGQ